MSRISIGVNIVIKKCSNGRVCRRWSFFQCCFSCNNNDIRGHRGKPHLIESIKCSGES